MDIINILSLIVGIAGVSLAVYFYMKSKKHSELSKTEIQMQLTESQIQLTESQRRLKNIEESIIPYRIQERATNYPDIKREQNIRKAFEALLAFILIIILAGVIASYFSDTSKKR